MNVSVLLQSLAAHSVELNPDRFSLPAPNWPADCPKHLRDAFAKYRRAIMARIASPVFVHIETIPAYEGRVNRSRRMHKEMLEESICLVQIDDLIIVWLPGLTDESVEAITRQIGMQLQPAQTTQIVSGRTMPLILRRAMRSGRPFCCWNNQTTAMSFWHVMGLPTPARWIELRDLARAGGWPENFDDLVWNVLHVPPEMHNPLRSRSRNGFKKSLGELRGDQIARIRHGLDQLLSVADLYDRLQQHDEPDLLELNNEINRRGIGLDVESARIALSVCQQHAERQFAHIAEATGGTMTPANLLDNGFVISWLRSWGLHLPDLNAETIEWLLSQTRAADLQNHPSVEAVLHARISLAHQPIGTLMRSLEMVDGNGRVRNHIKYFTKRSGEFSSPGIDIRDLFFASHWEYTWKRGIATEALRNQKSYASTVDQRTDDELARMVLNCFVPSENRVFTVVSWDDLEVEVLRWLLGDLLEFPHDPEEVWIDLLPPWIDQARRTLAQLLRDSLFHGGLPTVCKCRLVVTPDVIDVVLPSGRAIHYRTVTSFRGNDPSSFNESNALRHLDTSPHAGWPDVDGMVLDIVRGVSRDILASAMIRCAGAGGEIVAHGSDFIILEVAKEALGRSANAPVESSLLIPPWADVLKFENGCMTCWRLGGGTTKLGQHTNDVTF